MLPRRLKKNRHIDRLKSIDHTPLKQGYIPASGVFFSPHTNTLIQGLAIPLLFRLNTLFIGSFFLIISISSRCIPGFHRHGVP